MAGDWIPMRTNLEDDPTVIFISRVSKLAPDHVVGKLHRFWSWVDSHTIDGRIDGIDAGWIDQHVKKRGFANAMATAPTPWLSIDEDGVTVPNYLNWFGSSAKSRLSNTKRQSDKRASNTETPRRACITAAVKRQVRERDGVNCRYCGYDTSQKAPPFGPRMDCTSPHFDHVIPVSRGGSNTAENIVIACQCCNMRKSNRTPDEAGMSLNPVTTVTQSSDKRVTTEEKSTEEKSTPPTPNSNGGGVAADFAEAWKRSKPIAEKVRTAIEPDKTRRLSKSNLEWVIRVAILSDRFGGEWLAPAFEAVKHTKNVSNPVGLMGSVLNDECLRIGTTLNRELASVTIPESMLSQPQ